MAKRTQADKAPATEVEHVNPNPTAAYLEALGVELDPRALEPPDIEALVHQGERPWDWLDKHGEPVPDDLGLELYRVEDMGEDTKLVVQAKEAEGFRLMPDDAGFRMRALHTPGREQIMFRTLAQRRAHERAAVLREQQRKRAARGQRHAVAGLPDDPTLPADEQGLRSSAQFRDVQVPVALRD